MGKKRYIISASLGFAWCIITVGAFFLGAKSAHQNSAVIRDFPSLSSAAILDGSWFSDFGQYAITQLGMREKAVASYTRLNMKLFGETGTPDVSLGEDGWLFLTETIEKPCAPSALIEKRMRDIAEVGAALRGRGVKLLWAIAPDKEAAYSEQLSATQRERAACATKNRETMRRLIKDPAISPYFVDLWSAIEKGKIAHADHFLYRQYDTHWNFRGAWVAARAILNAMERNVWLERNVTLSRTYQRSGDLGRMIGVNLEEQEQRFETHRTGVEAIRPARPFCFPPEQKHVQSLVHLADESHIARMIDGHTLILKDSFFNNLQPLIFPYLTQLDMVDFLNFDQVNMRLVSRCTNLILVQTVERFFLRYAEPFRESFRPAKPEDAKTDGNSSAPETPPSLATPST